MTTISRAWQAFLDAIAKAKELHERGAAADVLADLLQHARELLDIIEEEFASDQGVVPESARNALGDLRSRVVALEQAIVTKH